MAFLVVLPVIWFYVLFDAIHQYKRKQAGEELIDRTFMDDFHDNNYTGKKSHDRHGISHFSWSRPYVFRTPKAGLSAYGCISDNHLHP
ncbi:hypothetical protein P7H12_06105 [Paenibacillus larvae]|nr:hypothetical protein [Paenibacillus larvae]MDT2263275.1 hypothetical protein [Paenibacillus larvae]